METIVIRQAGPQDAGRLQGIGRQTFSETFSESNTEENMRAYLDESFSDARIAAELSNPGSQFYLAEREGAAIGYLKLNSGAAQTEPQDGNALEIERIYVLKEFHGMKVGQLLYEQALQVARQRAAPYLWLGVWDQNRRAIRFYEKNGFVAFDKHLFRLGDDVQTDIMMKLHLADR